MKQMIHDPRAIDPRRFRAGISFVEVMFAVIILGIGFIIIAGVFPVAIKQTQETMDASVMTAMGKNAIKSIEAIATTGVPLANTGGVVEVNDPRLSLVKGDRIYQASRRYAWIPFFVGEAAQAKLLIVGVQSPNRTNYQPGDLDTETLSATALEVNLNYDGNTGILEITNPSDPDEIRAAEGSYVILQNVVAGEIKVYRLSKPTTPGSRMRWELSLDYSMIDGTENGTNVDAWIIGRAPREQEFDFNASTNPYVGRTQEIGLYFGSISYP